MIDEAALHAFPFSLQCLLVDLLIDVKERRLCRSNVFASLYGIIACGVSQSEPERMTDTLRFVTHAHNNMIFPTVRSA